MSSQVGSQHDAAAALAAAPPIVFAVLLPTGPASGGNLVTIVGSGFTGATAVKFGANPATSFTVVSDNVITAVAPPGSGTVQVTVTTANGTSNGFPYLYIGVPGPVIVTAVPPTGPATGGNLVTIVGSGFTGATAVNFGATPATSFTVISDNLIVATAPAGTGTVPITVVTPAGTSTSFSYLYV
ncbi:IPT/TIG domain-containing protein [Streptomyces sp. NPDC002055]|uniref:IPT/TIG domain-containing protein n=1 Tax=Streptomyces sp. NPDC002055 TaxID=3154534 RepID=UPI00331B543E